MYQTFPDKKGASDSEGKLKALHFPPLRGKSFLDLGCNEGFFCHYAKEQGATKILGIDYDKKWIDLAKERNPDIQFVCDSWNNLGTDQWDVILFSSSLHYVEEPIKFFKNVHAHLKDDGVIVLEVGLSSPNMIYPSGVEHQFRHDGLRIYPTYETLKKWMPDFSLRWIAQSVDQAGDKIPRFVIHAKKKKTVVSVIEGNPGAGKTNFSKLLKGDVTIHVDTLKEFDGVPNIMEHWNGMSNDGREIIKDTIRNLILINKGVESIVVEGYILKDIPIESLLDEGFIVKRVSL